MFGEDKFINDYFKKKTNGVYIDVGCYHPLDGNNTHLLFKKGWNGINIDINFFSISLFNFLR
ncbi:SAM-dependent methyltransferase, partial [Candidatus Pelagibacter sp.]|nr:SAM-dependent methyltransferase [Candidatus Pelagibacter sp.]